jgi:hypothetical protein
VTGLPALLLPRLALPPPWSLLALLLLLPSLLPTVWSPAVLLLGTLLPVDSCW